MGALTLSAGAVVYVDAQVLICGVEQRSAWEAVLDPLWTAYQAGTVDVLTSELSLLEVLVRPRRDGDGRLETAYREALNGGLASMVRSAPRRSNWRRICVPPIRPCAHRTPSTPRPRCEKAVVLS